MSNLIDKKNVWAVGYGFKDSRSLIKKIKNLQKRRRGETAIRCWVNKKEKEEDLDEKDLIPKYIDGKETDVKVGEMPSHLGEYRKKHRPMKAGISMCNAYLTACTAGIPVYKEGKVFSLVNNHCQKRLDGTLKRGDPILQPSRFDGGSLEEHAVGETHEWYERSIDKLNEMDAGLNWVKKKLLRRTLKREYVPKIGEDVRPGDIVWKEGRTTGYTKAKVLDVDVEARVNSDDGVVKYKGMTLTEPRLGDAGDSSSAVFNKLNKVVEQLFAGSESIMVTQPIKRLLDHFNVSLTPEKEALYMADGWFNIVPESVEKDNLEVIINTYWGMNVRDEAGLHGDIIRKAKKGEAVRLLGYAGECDGYDWYKIEFL